MPLSAAVAAIEPAAALLTLAAKARILVTFSQLGAGWLA
jgi:hypothetical protein